MCIRIAYGTQVRETLTMASTWQNKQSGNWLIKFQYDGKSYCRSCRTKSRADASRVKSTVEDTLHLLNTGRLVMPHVPDIGKWIMSGGRVDVVRSSGKPKIAKFGEICDAYRRDQLDKAESTQDCELIHIGHLLRCLGKDTDVKSIDLATLQNYVSKRGRADNRMGGTVSGTTIKKELTTFMQISRCFVISICRSVMMKPRSWRKSKTSMYVAKCKGTVRRAPSVRWQSNGTRIWKCSRTAAGNCSK